MNDSDNIAQIAAYLDNDMSPEERDDFEVRLQDDPELASELRAMQAMAEDSKSFYRKEALVDSIVAQNATATIKPLWQRPLFRLALAVAAGLVLILTFGPLLIQEEPTDFQALYVEYFEAYDDSGLMAQRGDSDSLNLWQKAGDAYRAGDYSTAEASFLTIVEEDSTNIPAAFYLANSLLAQGKTDLAIPHLKYIIARKDFLYTKQATWLLALAYVQAEKPQMAIPLLKQLQQNQDAIGKNASALLEKLDP